MIKTPDNDPVQWIRPADLIAVDQVNPRFHSDPEFGQIARVILSVTIGVKHKFLSGRRESAAQRSSTPPDSPREAGGASVFLGVVAGGTDEDPRSTRRKMKEVKVIGMQQKRSKPKEKIERFGLFYQGLIINLQTGIILQLKIAMN